MRTVELAVIGAGPYGLALAAHAQAQGIDTLVLGRPMGFWREHMPAGMFLRSGRDWHLDVADVDTFSAFSALTGTADADSGPIPMAQVLAYADWFLERKRLTIQPAFVRGAASTSDGIVLELSDREPITARTVVAAPGIAEFPALPTWAAEVPPGQRRHTVERVTFDDLQGERCVIVGGRQSAYEWAALAGEHGAAAVDVVHRHAVPLFAPVDWTFVDGYMAETLVDPGWWRGLPQSRRDEIGAQFWAAGRLTLEPWLPPRLDPARVRSWPGSQVLAVELASDGSVALTLSGNHQLSADQVIFATGYRADLAKVQYLSPLLGSIDHRDGFPVLSPQFATSVPGLYMTGFLATEDFGPFFGFMRGAVVSAAIIVDDIARTFGSRR